MKNPYVTILEPLLRVKIVLGLLVLHCWPVPREIFGGHCTTWRPKICNGRYFQKDADRAERIQDLKSRKELKEFWFNMYCMWPGTGKRKAWDTLVHGRSYARLPLCLIPELGNSRAEKSQQHKAKEVLSLLIYTLIHSISEGKTGVPNVLCLRQSTNNRVTFMVQSGISSCRFRQRGPEKLWSSLDHRWCSLCSSTA